MESLRVITLNIWNRGGPWEQRLALIRAEIERQEPDIVGLQEVLQMQVGDETQCQAREIAEGLGFEVAFGLGHELDFAGPTGVLFGNAVLSRFPIEERAVFVLPGHDRSDQRRSLLFARLDTPRGPLPVFVTHLNWKLDESAIRVEQVRHLAEEIERLAPRRADELPAVLVGDLNAEPESDEIRFLAGLATLQGQSTHFADAWRYAGKGPGYTFDPRNTYAAACHEPPRRIDYVLVRSPGLDGLGRPIRAELVFTESTDGVFPSDHFGVLAELDVRAS